MVVTIYLQVYSLAVTPNIYLCRLAMFVISNCITFESPEVSLKPESEVLTFLSWQNIPNSLTDRSCAVISTVYIPVYIIQVHIYMIHCLRHTVTHQ